MSQSLIIPLNEVSIQPSEGSSLSPWGDAASATSIDFMEAMLAAGAIMAHADGEMASAERRKIMALVRESPILSVFSRDEIVEELATHEANYQLDPEVAHLLAREKLVRVAGNRRLALRIIEACRAVLRADGVAHPSEYRALSEIREMLGLEAFASLHLVRGEQRS